MWSFLVTLLCYFSANTLYCSESVSVSVDVLSASPSSSSSLSFSSSSSSTAAGSSSVIATNDVPLFTGSTTWNVNTVSSFVVGNCIQITWTQDNQDYMLAVITAVNPSGPTITANSLSISPTNSGLNIPWTPWFFTPATPSLCVLAPSSSSSTASSSPPPAATNTLYPLVSNLDDTLNSGVVGTFTPYYGASISAIYTNVGGGRGTAYTCTQQGQGTNWVETNSATILSSPLSAPIGVSYTVSMWFFGDFAQGAYDSTLMSNQFGPQRPTSFWIGITATGILYFGHGATAYTNGNLVLFQTTGLVTQTMGDPSASSWNQVAVTWDASTSIGTLYLNGNLVNRTTVANPPTGWTGSGADQFFLGSSITLFSNPFYGSLQCVQWMDVAASSTGIQTLFQLELNEDTCVALSPTNSYAAPPAPAVDPALYDLNAGSFTDSATGATGGLFTTTIPHTGTAGTNLFPTVGTRGVAYNASGNAIILASPLSNPLGQSYTVSFWLYDAIVPTSGLSFLLLTNIGLNLPQSFWVIAQSPNVISFGHGPTFRDFVVCVFSGLNTAAWHHFTLSWNNAGASATIYLDGAVCVGPTTVSSPPFWIGSSSVMQIGGYQATTGAIPFVGALQCVQWASFAITSAKASAFYTQESSSNACSSLSSYT